MSYKTGRRDFLKASAAGAIVGAVASPGGGIDLANASAKPQIKVASSQEAATMQASCSSGQMPAKSATKTKTLSKSPNTQNCVSITSNKAA